MRTFLDITGIAVEEPPPRERAEKRKASMMWAQDRYAPIRQAAWHFRNSRPGEHDTTREQLRDAAQLLIEEGEHSAAVLDALLELVRN